LSRIVVDNCLHNLQFVFAAFEEARRKKEQKEEQQRRKKNKKNKIEEIQKPRGYERGLELEKIVGFADSTSELFYLVKWKDLDEFDLLTAKEIHEKDPDFIISFYESNSRIVKKVDERKKLTEYPEYTSETQIPDIEDGWFFLNIILIRLNLGFFQAEEDAGAEEEPAEATEAGNETVQSEVDATIEPQGEEQQPQEVQEQQQVEDQQQIEVNMAHRKLNFLF
jgi:Chromo shadow domain